MYVVVGSSCYVPGPVSQYRNIQYRYTCTRVCIKSYCNRKTRKQRSRHGRSRPWTCILILNTRIHTGTAHVLSQPIAVASCGVLTIMGPLAHAQQSDGVTGEVRSPEVETRSL